MNSFFKDLLERALKTAAQTAIATIGTTATLGAVDWKLVLSTVLMASLLSALTSIASRSITSTNTASLVNAATCEEVQDEIK